MVKNMGLKSTLNMVLENTDNSEINLGEVVEVLNSRGFGPLLIVPSVLTILPTGAIPGMAAICGIIIIFVASQILFFRNNPWFPKFIKKISFDRKNYETSLKKINPYIAKIDKLSSKRFELLTGHVAQKIIAFINIILGITFIPFDFIPFAAVVPAIPVLFFGLGLGAKDGLLTGIGLVLTIGAAIFVMWLLGIV